VGGVLRDDCAIGLLRHDEPEKFFAGLKMSICDELR
jgi:hypothetical protein